jgi:hypothetical protein
MGKTIALRYENVSFRKKPLLYALKTLNLKLTLPSLGNYKQGLKTTFNVGILRPKVPSSV